MYKFTHFMDWEGCAVQDMLNFKADYISFGHRIRERRKVLGLTQLQLAERANLSLPFTSNLERAATSPSTDTVIKLAIILETSLDYLFQDTLPYALSGEVDEKIANVLGKMSPVEKEYVYENLISFKKFGQRLMKNSI